MKKSKLLLFLGVLILLLSGTSVGHAYSVTTYTGPGSFVNFLAAISPNSPVIENFEDTTLISGLSITEVGGAGAIHDGVYENIDNSAVPRYQIFNYNSMTAFGAWLDLVGPGGPGSSIDMYINDGLQFVMNVPNTAAGEFYGFITDLPFTGVRFSEGNDPYGFQETYFAVDLGLVIGPAVPIPPTAYLTIAGLIPFIRLRRKSLMA